MSLASAVGRLLLGKQRREKAREDRRRKTLREFSRRRAFEPLEDRQLLDAASLYETLPPTITIADPSSYHYAYEGRPIEFIDTGSISGLNASFVQGNQVAFTVLKTSTDGAVSSLGEVVIQLFESEGEAPNSSSHFLSLVFDDYYEGKAIHRVISNFMFQGGSSDGYGYEGSGMEIADEHSELLKHNKRGMVAYANRGADTSDAQFYVTFDQTSWLDGKYNVFGFVVDGYDVIDELEKVETTKNPKSSEASYPVEKYTLSNVYVISPEKATQSALRLVADKDASGVTTISYTSQLADDALDFQETKVYVGQEGLQEYLKAALAETNFDIVAGQTIDVSLPAEFGGYKATYTVTPATTPEGYSINYKTDSKSEFSVVTTEAGAQFTTLTIQAKLENGMTASVEQAIYVSPSTPTVKLESGTDVKVGELEGNAYIISSDLADSALRIDVVYAGLNQGATTEAPLSVFVDDTEYAYTVEAHTFDEETLQHSYTLALTLGAADKLADGVHEIKVREYLPIDRVTTHERLYSEFVSYDVLVDTVPLAFTEVSTVLDITAGSHGLLQITTNKADESGVNRSDVKFELANPSAGPRFISLTDDGVLGWDDVTVEDAGVYYVNVNATDALGTKVTKKFTLNVGFVPIFDNLDDLTAKTGETFATKVVATVPSSGTVDVKVKYELIGDKIEGLAIDESTGDVSWNVSADYIDSAAVNVQSTSFSVKATSLIKNAQGGYDEGAASEKTFFLTVDNARYDQSVAVAPEIEKIEDVTLVPGESLKKQIVATVPESYAGIDYKLVDAPDGTTLDAKGVLNWTIPSDFFSSTATKSKTITVKFAATSIVSTADNAVNYGDSAESSFKVVVVNPDYVDEKPVFDALDVTAGTTGTTFAATVKATDPNAQADRIVYELIGTYPSSLALDATTGALVWGVPADYLATNVSYQRAYVTVKATEQYLNEGVYSDGLSAERTFEIMIANAKYDKTQAFVPEWKDIPAQTVEAGKTFELTVSAEAKKTETKVEAKADDKKDDEEPNPGSDAEQDDLEYGVEYELTGEYPEGMGIDPDSGKIVWDVPSDYFKDSSVKEEKIKITVKATTVMGDSETGVDYGGSSSKTFDLTVTNPSFTDKAPVFNELSSAVTSTGKTYTATIKATDPDGKADKIKYELVGTGYPTSFKFDAAKGTVSWTIPATYLSGNISAQVFSFTVKATEQFLKEGSKTEYNDGQSTSKTFELMVANAAYKASEAVAPIFDAIAAQTVESGKKFELTAKAAASTEVEKKTTDKDGKETVTKEKVNYEVEYSLTGDYPKGMTIDSATGKISWDVPEDYFSRVSIKSDELKISVIAKTVVSKDSVAKNYGAATTKTFDLTVMNAKYEPSAIADWSEWVDAWVENAQSRYDGHADNLADYLDSYLKAIDTRTQSLAKAKEDYSAGKKTLTEFLNERKEIVNNFDKTVEDARKTLADADAKVDSECDKQQLTLNDVKKDLDSDKALTKPENVEAKAEAAAQQTTKDKVEKTTGNARFRISSSNGAKVATDLTSVLKLWREGYSYSTVYDEVYSDKIFAESAGQETTPDKKDETSGDKKEESTDKKEETSGDKKEESTDKKEETSDDKKEESTDKKEETSDDKKEDEKVETPVEEKK